MTSEKATRVSPVSPKSKLTFRATRTWSMRAAWIHGGARIPAIQMRCTQVTRSNAWTFLEALSGRNLHEETERDAARPILSMGKKPGRGCACANTTKAGFRRKTSRRLPWNTSTRRCQIVRDDAWIKLRAREITWHIKVPTNSKFLQ